MHKQYVGLRSTIHGLRVFVTHDTSPHPDPRKLDDLDPRFDLRNHSPSGFECGYAGSGPAQLALALLADALADDVAAAFLYQRFKFEKVQQMPGDRSWRLQQTEILTWAEPYLRRHAQELELLRDLWEDERAEEPDPGTVEPEERPDLYEDPFPEPCPGWAPRKGDPACYCGPSRFACPVCDPDAA